MTEQRRIIIHNVAVYSLPGEYYIVGLVRDNISWLQVLPVYRVPIHDSVRIAEAVESAMLESRRLSHQESLKTVKPWDGYNKRVWKDASKSWSILWYDDGSVLVQPKEQFSPPQDEPDLIGGVGWRPIRNAEKLLSPPVATSDILQQFDVE